MQGPNVSQPQCPQCGRPPSPQNPILVCEYCGTSLMVAAPPGPPPYGPQVAPFGGVGPGYAPLYTITTRRRGNPAFAIIFAGVGLIGVGGAVAATMLTRSHAEPIAIPQDDHAPPAPRGGQNNAANATGAAMFEAKCSQGDAPSCVALGTMYENGQGVPVDKPRAVSYYAKACALGDQSGCMLRDMGGMHGTPPTNVKRR